MAFHRYVVFDSRNTEEALTVFYRLSFVSSAIATFAAWAAHHLAGLYPALSILLAPPATALVYQALARLNTQHLWKTWVGWCLGVQTKYVAGKWNAEVEKKLLDGSTPRDLGILQIEQTWRMISITLDTDLTESESTSASMILEAGKLKIEYRYYAKKKHSQGIRFEDHVGSASLSIPVVDGEPDMKSMQLTYFTNHGESGSIKLKQA